MSKLEAIEADIRALPVEQAKQLQDWLSDYLEERAELNPKFVESIERGKVDLKSGQKKSRGFVRRGKALVYSSGSSDVLTNDAERAVIDQVRQETNEPSQTS
jgi:hypothetical protein